MPNTKINKKIMEEKNDNAKGSVEQSHGLEIFKLTIEL